MPVSTFKRRIKIKPEELEKRQGISYSRYVNVCTGQWNRELYGSPPEQMSDWQYNWKAYLAGDDYGHFVPDFTAANQAGIIWELQRVISLLRGQRQNIPNIQIDACTRLVDAERYLRCAIDSLQIQPRVPSPF